MRRLSVVIVSLLVGASLQVGPADAGAPTPGSQARGIASYKFLKAQVFTAPGLGSIAVGMPDDKVVKVQRLGTDGSWTRPTTLFKKKNVTCGQIKGRASAGGVALILECDTPYYEDQAPVDSRALVTNDLSTWANKELDGEAYQDPAISSNGSHAAWLYGAHGQYLLYSAGSGFTSGHTGFDYDSGGETVVVDDAGTVTVMGADGNGEGCELGVWDKPLAGAEDHYVIPGVDPGCTEGGVDNVDDRTVVGGGAREHRFEITRSPGARWALTTRPPIESPSLVTYGGPRRTVIRNVFSDADGQALVSVGSPDRQHIYAQAFDDESRTWGPSTLVRDQRAPRCRAQGYYPYEPLPRLHAVPLLCGRGTLLLTSPDSSTWTATRIGRRPYGLSRNGALLAAPGARSTRVVSPAGTTTVPVTAPGRCDFVFPIGPDSVLRLHGRDAARWPTKVQTSVAGARWKTIQTLRMPRTGSCHRITAQHYDPPSVFFLRGDGHYLSFRVHRGGPGGWHVAPYQF